VPGGEQDPLSARSRRTQPLARRPAGSEDRLRADVDGPEPGVSVDGRPGGGLNEREDVVEFEPRRDGGHPELLVGVPIKEHEGVVPDVVERVRRRAGDVAVQEPRQELPLGHRSRAPAVVEAGESSDVGFDNVHGSGHGTGGEAMQLKGAVAVVTGASSGIGESTAIALAQRGANVVLAARRLDRLDELADRMERTGGRALAVRCDVEDHEQLRKLRVVTEEAFGPTDILVNNAGVPSRGPFETLPYEQIQRVVQVNLTGVLFGTRAFLPGMLTRRHGHIVNMASLAGRFVAPGAALYSATKHAVVGFSEALNYETEGRNVLVTAVNPGFVATEGFPQGDLPDAIVMKVEKVSNAVIRVLADGIAPEYAVPRWLSPLQAFRVLTPPVYRWGMRRVRSAGATPTAAPEP
jgi:short-subunit dehydrogenase